MPHKELAQACLSFVQQDQSGMLFFKCMVVVQFAGINEGNKTRPILGQQFFSTRADHFIGKFR